MLQALFCLVGFTGTVPFHIVQDWCRSSDVFLAACVLLRARAMC